MDVDLYNDPIGQDSDGQPVMLRDIWPTPEEVRTEVAKGVTTDAFRKEYSNVFEGDDMWRSMPVPEGELFAWDPDSTYVRELPFFSDMPAEPTAPGDVKGARVLALLGDSVTTDHISPAGSIERNGPAARYLTEHGVEPKDFNQYGARRGNHEVMMRGTFANVRLKNQIAPGTEGGWTVHQPDNEQLTIFDAAMKYQEEGTPLIVIAGKEYGTGSSRDWAAKGPRLLGVKAAIVESFERIHRSNLIGMGILPLEFTKGENAESLGLTGFETYDISRRGRRPERAQGVGGHCHQGHGRDHHLPGDLPHRHARRAGVSPATAGSWSTCSGNWPERHNLVPSAAGPRLHSRAGGTLSHSPAAIDNIHGESVRIPASKDQSPRAVPVFREPHTV